ncbi:MAG: shikimate kinase [Halioglobus sp.]
MLDRPDYPNTISLIGMPGAGKSTVGVILAKLTGLRFVDTDIEIQQTQSATLQEILEEAGYLALRDIEQQVVLATDLNRAIISTGGSVVYGGAAMSYLQQAGPVVYLRCALDQLQSRVASAPNRGIASQLGQSFADIYAERTPLYTQYADITVDASLGTADQVAAAILAALKT